MYGPKNGCWAPFTYVSQKGISHGLSFPLLRNDGDYAFSCKQAGYGHRDCLLGYVFEAGEVALSNLLPSTRFIKFDNLYPLILAEVSIRRIVEGQMPVLTKAHAT